MNRTLCAICMTTALAACAHPTSTPPAAPSEAPDTQAQAITSVAHEQRGATAIVVSSAPAITVVTSTPSTDAQSFAATAFERCFDLGYAGDVCLERATDFVAAGGASPELTLAIGKTIARRLEPELAVPFFQAAAAAGGAVCADPEVQRSVLAALALPATSEQAHALDDTCRSAEGAAG